METDRSKGWKLVHIPYCEYRHFKCNAKDWNALPSEYYSVDCMKWASGSQSGFEWLYHHCKNLQKHEGWTALKIILCCRHKSQCFHHINHWDTYLNCAHCRSACRISIFHYEQIYFHGNSSCTCFPKGVCLHSWRWHTGFT